MRALLVSIAFPPKRDPECLQTGKMFKYLATEQDMTWDVVTSSSPTLNMPIDRGLASLDTGYQQKIEIPLWEHRLTNYLLRKLFPGRLDTPDSKRAFAQAWPVVAQRLRQPPNLIYSRSNPISSALLAAHLKRYFQVPWVMHLSDPWAGNPFADPTVFAANRVLEEQHFALADRISLTSERTREFYTERYPAWRDRFVVFPNVYDPADALPRLRILHTGGLMGARSATPLLRALERLSPSVTIDVIFAGPADRTNRRVFAQCQLPGVRWLGEVSYARCKELQEWADLLLCLESPAPDSRQAMFFPSKILDYMVAGKPMLAITTPGSEVDQTFLRYGWPSFAHHQTAELAAHVEQIACARIAPALPLEYDARLNAKRLAQLFKEVVPKIGKI